MTQSRVPCAKKLQELRDDASAALAITVLVAALPGIVVKALAHEVVSATWWVVKRRLYVRGADLWLREPELPHVIVDDR